MGFERCIFILIDGARPDSFEELLAKGDLPAIQRYCLEGGFYRRILSSFPSATGPAYLPFLTGCMPGHCNVPGIRWLDRSRFGKWFPKLGGSRSYVGAGSFFMNHDIAPHVRTLFEKAKRPANLYSFIHRGAGFFGNKTPLLGPLLALYGRASKNWLKVDQLIGSLLLHTLNEGDPDFLFVVFPAVDEYSHLSSPSDVRVADAFRGIDRTIAEAASLLKKKGKLDTTLWVISSDHGLTDTDAHYNLEAAVSSVSASKAYSYPKIYRLGAKAAVMPSGNAMAHLYAKKNDSWKEPSLDHELQKSWTGKLIEELVSSPAIAWIATKESASSLVLRSCSGLAKGRLEKKEDGRSLWHYEVQGGDPLHLESVRFPLSPSEFTRSTFDFIYPDALNQIAQLVESPRCGDMIVNANVGFDLRTSFEFPEHHSSHGSLHREHMQVPFACNVAPQNMDAILRSVDVHSFICKLMGFEGNVLEVDGAKPPKKEAA